MHAAEAVLLLALGRGAPGLVVGDHQLAVGVELEAVDDAAQRGPPAMGTSSMSSRPMGLMVVGSSSSK